MIYLKKFLDIVINDTFISVQWEWDFEEDNGIYSYQGLKKYFDDVDDLMTVEKLRVDQEKGLIVVISYDVDTRL